MVRLNKVVENFKLKILSILAGVPRMSMTIYKRPYADQVINKKEVNTERSKGTKSKHVEFMTPERGTESFTESVNKKDN